jgi:hypothetical protein
MKKITDRFIFYSRWLIALGCLLTGCQYRFGSGDLASRYETLSVPYAEGDKEGMLTEEVIKRISTSGAFRFVTYGGDLTLKMKIVEFSNENIGFRYDRHKRGRLKKTLIPTETRLSSGVDVEVLDAATGQRIRGPIRIVAGVDFDHDFYSSRNAVNIFSLGQLSDIDASHDAAMRPLNRELANKIADYIINSW